ncbi:alkene reductase, partial [Cronobacter sakazakii]
MSTLLEPVNIGALELKNRVVMAPLTRMRAVNDRTPGEIVKTYYTQRASAG